jgi:hypothetical protein
VTADGRPKVGPGSFVVAGTGLGRDEVLALASMLSRDGSDRTARLLLAALTRGESFVALTTTDKEHVLATLTRRKGLTELRHALFDELNWQREGLRPPDVPQGIATLTSRRRDERVNVAWV